MRPAVIFSTVILSIQLLLVEGQNDTQQQGDPLIVGTEAAATQPPRQSSVTKRLRSQTKAPESEQSPSSTASRSFQTDCSDPHNKEIGCSVHIVSCNDELFPPVAVGQEPPEAHDVRVNSYAKAVIRPKGFHTLHVDISWQMPPSSASTRIKAFKLEIEPTDGVSNASSSCFAFNVTDFGWTVDKASPRFHFSTESLFEFAADYRISLYSLPSSNAKQPKIVRDTKMPENPEGDDQFDPRNMTEYCKTHTHTAASKWTAGFRRIFLMTVTRTIQIEFVGAPLQYCFEQYEVRLLDGSGLEMLHSTVINAKDMKYEEIDGKIYAFGEHNFTGLELDTEYIPSVIPMETSNDGRCLCPTDSHACSCVAADWKKVKLDSLKPSNIKPYTVPPPAIVESHDNWLLFSLLLLLCMIVGLIVLISVIIMFYRKYRNRGKAVRIRFISDSSNNPAASEPKTPLIYNSSTSILILYSHDSPLHEAVVAAFAELLRDSFKLDVHMDCWDGDEIESNLAEYVNASIVKADKIVIINSIGAYHRVRARHLKQDPISRVDEGIYDALFANQIDLALQHARVVSVKFSYTPSSSILFALSPLLQYSIPDNLGLLISSLVDCPLKNDSRLAGYNPELVRLNNAIAKMTAFVRAEPKWFELTHHRVSSSSSRAIPPIPAPLPSISTPIPVCVPDSSLDSGIAETEAIIPTVQTKTINEEEELMQREDDEEMQLQEKAGLTRTVTDSGILSDDYISSEGIRQSGDRQPLLEPGDITTTFEGTYSTSGSEVINEGEDECQSHIGQEQAIRHKDDEINGRYDDSAFYSQSINTAEIDPVSEVLDKPRLDLPQYTDKCSKKADQQANGELNGLINAN
ncbi:hypothetical protein WR25_05326 [Diploscapter pachys]|uniref:SEFIR domain-containing protein n=1 Tax=Diploscapter pachys TaxID=2018661 RepID=A0A2A2M132_9BILA|nr:hypothetical protein WR25_05326 [Diploscapter pachys]